MKNTKLLGAWDLSFGSCAIKRTWSMSLLLLSVLQLASSQWVIQKSGILSELRGLSAVNENVAWVSGSRNMYARTINGGETWEVHTLADTARLDFRDVEAFSADITYLLSIGEETKSRIFKTVDGGKNWKLQFMNRRAGAFFDALAFWDEQNGIAMSDVVDGKLLLIRTSDGGEHWNEIPQSQLPPALPGEGGFAASGTCIVIEGTRNVWIGASGGSRVYRSTDRGDSWSVAETPLMKDSPASGIFSIAFFDAQNGIIVGGNYQKEREAKENIALTNDGGNTWMLLADSSLGGFRSCVAYLPGSNGKYLIATGPAGTDYSVNGGKSWAPYDSLGFHVLGFSKNKLFGWAAGRGGRIAKFRARVD
ncbi:MAG: oxidoreductase [bacterium]